MLLFIPGYRWTSRTSILFQYISCYSLSLTRQWSMQRYLSFNTSHVTLYLTSKADKTALAQTFQYISCYSLSGSCSKYITESIRFQYISCYSLSWGRRQPTEQTDVSIHLMLLFIEDELSKIADSGRFNTSHVTLYRYIRGIIIVILWFQYISCYSLSVWSSLSFLKWFVSIHLMLLFIKLHLW